MRYPTASAVAPIIALGTVGSTFDAVDELAPHLTTWVSTDQRAGRGRLGREWIAPAGKCIAACVLVRDDAIFAGAEDAPAASALGWLPLAAGLALARATDQTTASRARIKWPNDVLIDGNKVAGVLCERRDGAVVVGFGVNLTLRDEELPVERATSLRIAGASDDAEVLADRVLAATLAELKALLPLLGTSALHSAVTVRLDTLGRRVRAIMPSGDVVGIATGLTDFGELAVDLGDTITHIRAGDIVHLR